MPFNEIIDVYRETYTKLINTIYVQNSKAFEVKAVGTYVRYQVLMAASVKMIAFCDIAPCSLVEVD
jgi:hypothetical protein